MNGNRSRYTYTPAFGMQKRGLSRKSVPIRQVPEAPDFTQVPDPSIGTPLQQTAPLQQPQALNSAPQMSSYMPAPSYFTSNQPSSFSQQPTTQIPFAAPSFVQPGQHTPISPVQNVPQSNYQQLPLGNTLHSVQNLGHSSRAQGFVPPQPGVSPAPQLTTAPPQIGWSNPQAVPQSIPPFSNPAMGSSQQSSPYQAAQQQMPAYPPLQPIPQQPGFTVQATASHTAPRAASIDADKLWSIFLFGLLPLLFIPCLFVPSTWDVLRFLFIGTSVIGLGAMWYRQMYNPATRLIVSIVYVALCIATIAMLMQGANDAKQTAANMAQNQQQTQQQNNVVPSPTPDAYSAGAVVLTPTPAPTVSGPSEAERRLDLFMELWKVNNTTEMVNLVQPSWRSQQENAAKSLFLALANRTPEDFTIEEISGTETDNSRTITMRATINKNTGKAPVVYRFMVMMVKEGGEWYVNPNSLATNDVDETTAEDENVVKTQSSGAVTEPPRETVTPAPPASTPLYYNIGGNYYHMDSNCPSVAKDYLPFDASFSYADLASYNRDLLPCLNCNAPVDTLD